MTKNPITEKYLRVIRPMCEARDLTLIDNGDGTVVIGDQLCENTGDTEEVLTSVRRKYFGKR